MHIQLKKSGSPAIYSPRGDKLAVFVELSPGENSYTVPEGEQLLIKGEGCEPFAVLRPGDKVRVTEEGGGYVHRILRKAEAPNTTVFHFCHAFQWGEKEAKTRRVVLTARTAEEAASAVFGLTNAPDGIFAVEADIVEQERGAYSVSVGDVLAVDREGATHFLLCCPYSWQPLSFTEYEDLKKGYAGVVYDEGRRRGWWHDVAERKEKEASKKGRRAV